MSLQLRRDKPPFPRLGHTEIIYFSSVTRQLNLSFSLTELGRKENISCSIGLSPSLGSETGPPVPHFFRAGQPGFCVSATA